MQRELYEFIDKAILEGIIEAECTECGIMIQCEPDASTAFCDNCNKVVRVKNILIEMGFI